MCFSKFILQNQKLDIIFVHFSVSQKSLGKKNTRNYIINGSTYLKERNPHTHTFIPFHISIAGDKSLLDYNGRHIRLQGWHYLITIGLTLRPLHGRPLDYTPFTVSRFATHFLISTLISRVTVENGTLSDARIVHFITDVIVAYISDIV